MKEILTRTSTVTEVQVSYLVLLRVSSLCSFVTVHCMDLSAPCTLKLIRIGDRFTVLAKTRRVIPSDPLTTELTGSIG